MKTYEIFMPELSLLMPYGQGINIPELVQVGYMLSTLSVLLFKLFMQT